MALLVYLVFQIHAAVFHGYWGQDFTAHKSWISQAAHNPWEYITTYRQGRTNPPLYHLLGGFLRRIVGLQNYLLAVGLMNVAFGLAGMIALYALACRLISSPLLRLAAMVFLLFLPFAVIHAEVIAADALATPLFFVFLWVIVGLPERMSRRSFGLSIAAASLVMIMGLVTKFTFASVLVGSAAWLLVAWRTRLLSGRRLIVAVVFILAIPASLAYAQMRQYTSQQTYNLGLSPNFSLAAVANAQMNPRSIVFLRSADTDVLAAPSYNWRLMYGALELVKPNLHSFPALLHLGMFTDILNIYQYDPYDSYYGLRTIPHHHRMQAAVRSGIVFSLLAFAGVVVILCRSSVSALIWRKVSDVPVLTLLLLSLAWFFNIVALLPFAPDAYVGGYWLPRLIAPALLGFFLTGFVFLDRSGWISRPVAIAVLCLVLAQSALHASFLWPTQSTDVLYEPVAKVLHTPQPVVMRIIDWQSGWAGRPAFLQGTLGYWLGKTMGVVIYRQGGSGLETWQLSFAAQAGPANPSPHRRLRISCRYCESKTVDFDTTAHIVTDVPVAPGRNDILIETVEPEQTVEKVSDPSVRLLWVSQIEFARSGVRAAWYFDTGPRTSLMSVSPGRATVPKQTFTVEVSDAFGYTDIDHVYFLIDDLPTIRQFTCHGYYEPSTGAILLYRDTTTLDAVRGTLGAGPPLSNGRCTFDPAASSASGAGALLTVRFALSLDPSYNRKKNFYVWIKDKTGGDNGWIDSDTTWDVAAVSATPPAAKHSAK